MADSEELTIESITSTVESPDKLSDEQKTFLEEHKAELEDDVATKYGITKEPPAPVVPPVTKTKTETKPTTTATPATTTTDDDDEITPEAKKEIDKQVSARLAPIEEHNLNTTIETEIQKEIGAHPEYKPYEKQIRDFVNHPNRRQFIKDGLPVSSVVTEALAPHLVKIGAQKEREAAAAAAATRGGGSTARQPSGQTKDWHNAPKEDFEAKHAEIMRGGN